MQMRRSARPGSPARRRIPERPAGRLHPRRMPERKLNRCRLREQRTSGPQTRRYPGWARLQRQRGPGRRCRTAPNRRTASATEFSEAHEPPSPASQSLQTGFYNGRPTRPAPSTPSACGPFPPSLRCQAWPQSSRATKDSAGEFRFCLKGAKRRENPQARATTPRLAPRTEPNFSDRGSRAVSARL